MTLKHWRLMSGEQIAKLASSCSLLLFFALAASGETYRELARDLNSARTVRDVVRISEEYPDLIEGDPALKNSIAELESDEQIPKLKQLVDLRAMTETDIAPGASGEAKQIKANPLYRDPGVQEQSNWLDGALKRLADLIPRNNSRPNIQLPSTAIPGWIVPVMWFLLGSAVLVFGFFAVRHFNWKRALTRKSKAVLEDDEPERSLDEWLELADRHAAEGRFRESVRAMYLSCLLKFDEAGIARFIRGETNWEHLGRIQSSIKLPSGLDFRPPTQAFDRIWYGHHVKGMEDVEQFRTWYRQIGEALRGGHR